MEVNSWTGFASEFTHISESESKMKNLDMSICAVLMAEACNIGHEPLTVLLTKFLPLPKMAFLKKQ